MYYINEPCEPDGDIVLGGTATLVVRQTNLTVDGDILLSGSARLIVSNATLALDNHFGQDQSILYVQHSGVLVPDSWLLGDLRGNAAVHVIQSNFPSEIYLHHGAVRQLQPVREMD
jgi:hypothetical protein